MGDPEVNECMEHLTKVLGMRPQGSAQGNRRYIWLLMPRMRELYPGRSAAESIKLLIDYGRMTFLGPMICDFKYLYYNHVRIIETVKRDIKDGKIKVKQAEPVVERHFYDGYGPEKSA